MFEFLAKGGFFMVPILLCSVAALAIFVERLLSLRRRAGGAGGPGPAR